MKGGSIARKHVMSLLSKNNNSQSTNTLPISNKKIIRVHQIAAGRKKKRRTQKKKSKGKGGSLYYISNKISKLRCASKKINPGKFPSIKNKNINWLKNSPRVIGGKKTKRGGSDWKSTLYSVSANKGYGKYSKQFTKTDPYVQTKKNIHNGKMFKPFQKPFKTFYSKTKINNLKMAQNIFDKILTINKSPMFLPLHNLKPP